MGIRWNSISFSLFLLFILLIVMSCSTGSNDSAPGRGITNDDDDSGGDDDHNNDDDQDDDDDDSADDDDASELPIVFSKFLAQNKTLVLPKNPDGTRQINIQCTEKIYQTGGILEILAENQTISLPLMEHQSVNLNPGSYTVQFTRSGVNKAETWSFEISDKELQTDLFQIERGTFQLSQTTGAGVLKALILKNNSTQEATQLRIAGAEGLSGYVQDERIESFQDTFWQVSSLKEDGTYNVEGGLWELFLRQLQMLPPQPGFETSDWNCTPFADIGGYDYCGGQAQKLCADLLQIMEGNVTCKWAKMTDHTIPIPCARGNRITGECFQWATVDPYLGIFPYNDNGEMVSPEDVRDNPDKVYFIETPDGQSLGGIGAGSAFLQHMATFEESDIENVLLPECEQTVEGGWSIPPGGRFQWTMESTGFAYSTPCIINGNCGGAYRLGSIQISVPLDKVQSYQWGPSITGYNAWDVEFTDITVASNFKADFFVDGKQLGTFDWSIPKGNSQIDLSNFLVAKKYIPKTLEMAVLQLPNGAVTANAYTQTNGQFQPMIDSDNRDISVTWDMGPNTLEFEIYRDTVVDSMDQVTIVYDRDEIRKNGFDALFLELIALQKGSSQKYSRGHRIELRAKNETGVMLLSPKDLSRYYPGQPYSDWIPLGEKRTTENETYWMLVAKPNAPSTIEIELYIDEVKKFFFIKEEQNSVWVDSLKIRTK